MQVHHTLMELEQKPPETVNFKLVVILFAVTILVIFVVAYLTLDWDGKRLVPHHHAQHPTSQLLQPHRADNQLA